MIGHIIDHGSVKVENKSLHVYKSFFGQTYIFLKIKNFDKNEQEYQSKQS